MAELIGITGRQVKDGTLGLEDITGLGDAATKNTGTGAGDVAAGDHGHSGVYEPANANIQGHISATGNVHSATPADIGAATAGHDHTGTYEPANSNIQTHIGSTSNPHSTTAAQVSALALNGGTLSGFLTLHADPTNSMHAVTKQYADAVAAGFGPKNSCKASTTTSLAAASYSNKVLTASANGAISIDDESPTSGQRVLIKDGVNVSGAGVSNVYNGIYTVTTVGDVDNPWVLTRASDFDGTPEGEVATGNYTFVEAGTINGRTGFAVLTTGTIDIDTTAITFGQVSSVADVSNLPTNNGGTGVTTYTQGDLLYYDSGTALSKLAKNVSATRALLNTGTNNNPAWGQVPLASGVSGTLPIANGGTGVDATSTTAKYFFAAPNASAGAPSFRAIVASDIPTLNQNTTGTAANVTGIVDEVNGGTGQSSYAVGDLLYASTTTALSKLADVATGNALISGGVGVAPSWGKIGLTTHISGTLAVGNGGTGVATLTGIVKGNGASAFTAATAGTDYVIPSGSITGNASTATQAYTTADATAASRYVVFAAASTSGNQGLLVDAGLTYNPSTNILTATLSGSSTSCTGNAASATYASAVTLTADNSTNATNYPLFCNAATGNLSPRTDTGFTYNPSTGRLTVATMNIGTAAPATPTNGDIWMV